MKLNEGELMDLPRSERSHIAAYFNLLSAVNDALTEESSLIREYSQEHKGDKAKLMQLASKRADIHTRIGASFSKYARLRGVYYEGSFSESRNYHRDFLKKEQPIEKPENDAEDRQSS